MKYYAVKKGKHPGIYTTWKDCQKEIDHFKDAKFKSFDSKKEALAYLKQNIYSTNSEVYPYLHLYNKGKKKRGKYEY